MENRTENAKKSNTVEKAVMHLNKTPKVKKNIKSVPAKVGTIQFNHVLLTTDYVGKTSSIITNISGETDKAMLSEIQTVVAAGPFAGGQIPDGEGGHTSLIKAGDKVLVDTAILSANRTNGGSVRLISFQYEKATGKLISSEYGSDLDEDEIDNYMMISDREILMILPK